MHQNYVMEDLHNMSVDSFTHTRKPIPSHLIPSHSISPLSPLHLCVYIFFSSLRGACPIRDLPTPGPPASSRPTLHPPSVRLLPPSTKKNKQLRYLAS